MFYYIWYDPSSDVSWNKSKIVDRPVLGYYNSSDKAAILPHLLLIKDLGVDFVVVSWWGFYDNYGKFTDEAFRQVLETAQMMGSPLKFALMVEPFNQTGNSYDYAGIYSHVYENCVQPYSSLYYNYNGKPLICFFNDETLTPAGVFPQDERFSAITVGQQNYTQWIYTNLNSYDLSTDSTRREISVTPRFDDSRFRALASIVDANLTESNYDREWQNAIRNATEGRIDYILVSSWNEYVERTQIEPCYDGTANNAQPFNLYDKTKNYIGQIP